MAEQPMTDPARVKFPVKCQDKLTFEPERLIRACAPMPLREHYVRERQGAGPVTLVTVEPIWPVRACARATATNKLDRHKCHTMGSDLKQQTKLGLPKEGAG
jgi:hypothetical protein